MAVEGLHAKPEGELAAIRAQIEGGHYAEAEAAARLLQARLEARDGAASTSVVPVLRLLVEALWRQGKAREEQTLQLAERATDLAERLAGPDHAETGACLHEWANVQSERGDSAEAVRLFERALAVREKALGPEHSAVAQTLGNLASERLVRGELSLARALNERALAIRERALGPEHPDVGKTLNNLAAVLEVTGEYADMRPLLERSLAIWEKRYGLEHHLVSVAVHNLGFLHWRLGEYDEARRLEQRALAIGEKTVGPEHPVLVGNLTLLGTLALYEGDFEASRAHYARALAISEKAYGAENPETAMVLYNLAVLHRSLGDPDEARALFERTVSIRDKALPADHPHLATALDSLADMLARAGERARARALYRRAQTIRASSLRPDHPRVADTLDGLAGLALGDGNVAEARRLYEEALAIRETALGAGHPETAASAESLARLEETSGNLALARSHLERALAIRENAFGTRHRPVIETQVALARLLSRGGQAREAVDAGLLAEAAAREQVRLTARGLSEKRALLFVSSIPRGLDVALGLLAAGATPARERAREILDGVVRSRALVLDEMASRNRLAAAEPELASLVRDLAVSRGCLARLVVRGPGEEPAARYRRLVDDARRAKERAEQALATRSLPFREEQARAVAGLAEVESALGPGDRLVSYVVHGQPASLLAFVLRPGQAPEVRSLGPVSEVAALVRGWREAVRFEAQAPGRAARRSRTRYRAAGEALRQRVFDPLSAMVAGATRVFLVADGPLHLVSFPALPMGRDRHLVETAVIHRLSTERDLLSSDVPDGAGMLTLGDADYDHGPAVAATEAPGGRFRGPLSVCPDVASLRFSPLAATAAEAETVARLWRSSGQPGELAVLRRRAASEAAFKDHARGRRVLHLATHGFFLGDDCSGPANPATKGPDENPLLRSGLALAGANHRQSAAANEEDGILTAEEVAALDLGGVAWAVLSACDTGLGNVRAGEGVFGLQRAFRLAGVQSLVMSLWPVEDRSAREWMGAFYRRRLRDALPTSQAVRGATLDLLRARRARGESDHPFYWGGFVAVGPDVR